MCLGVIGVVLFYAFIVSIGKALFTFALWVSRNPVGGVFVLPLVYALCVIFFVPGSTLTIGSTYAFSMAFPNSTGKALGLSLLTTWIGATIGCLT